MKAKILYVVCVAYIVAGISTYNTKVPTNVLKELNPGLSAHLNMFTVHQIGVMFILVSLLSIVLAAFKKVHLAYGLMTYILAFWSLLYLVSWIRTGYWQSVYGMANYMFVAVILIMCSRIVEMPKNMVDEDPMRALPLFDFKQGRESS
jgi:hypothetical protein